MKIRYSSACADIMIYNFDKVLEHSDYRYMVIGWDEYSKIKIDEVLAKENWEAIYNEFVLMSDDNKTVLYYQLLMEVNDVKATYYVVGELINLLPEISLEDSQQDFIDELALWGFRVNKDLSFADKVDQLAAQHKFYKNKIELKEHELAQFKDVEAKEPLMKQVVKLERALKRNLIDPRTTSVEKWQYLIEDLKHVA